MKLKNTKQDVSGIYTILNIKNNLHERKFFKDTIHILRSNIKVVQLRYKESDMDFFKYISKKIKKKCDDYNINLIINDNIDIMYNVDATGIHLGQNDLLKPNVDFEKLIYNKKIIGISVKTLDQALLAKKNGANYLGVGAIFKSFTKENSNVIGISGLKNITYIIDIPVIAIGGINLTNINELKNCKINGIAIVSTIKNASNKYLILKKLLFKYNDIKQYNEN